MRQMRSQRFSDQGEHHRKLLPFPAEGLADIADVNYVFTHLYNPPLLFIEGLYTLPLRGESRGNFNYIIPEGKTIIKTVILLPAGSKMLKGVLL